MVEMLARRFVHLRLPTLISLPIPTELVSIFEKADCQARGVTGAEGRGFIHSRTHHGLTQNVGLELHQKIVHYHSTVHAQEIEINVAILRHGFDHFTHLEGSRF